MTLYPGKIDNSISLPNVVDNITPIDANSINRLKDAIISIQTTLGANPASIYTNVKTRLENIETAISSSGNIALTGDLGGSTIDVKVVGIRGIPVSSTTPTTGQVLGFNGTSWVPTTGGGGGSSAPSGAANTVVTVDGALGFNSPTTSVNPILGGSTQVSAQIGGVTKLTISSSIATFSLPITTTDYVGFGSGTLATVGDMRSATGARTLISSRNSGNTNDYSILAKDSGGGLYIGTDENYTNAKQTPNIYMFAAADTDIYMGHGTTTTFSLTGNTLASFTVPVRTDDYFEIGSGTFATTGKVRLPSGAQTIISSRSPFISDNISVISLDSGTGLYIGTDENYTSTKQISNMYLFTAPDTDIYIGHGTTTLISLIGATNTVQLYKSTFQFEKTVSTPTIKHDGRTTDAATSDLTFTSQAPYTSATGSNRNPGNIVLNVPAKATGGSIGKIALKLDGTERAAITASSTNDARIQLNSSMSNMFIETTANSQVIYITASGSGARIENDTDDFTVKNAAGNTTRLQVNSTATTVANLVVSSTAFTGTTTQGAQTYVSNVDTKGTVYDKQPVNVQTTDATQTVLDSFTLASNTGVVVSALVIGIKSDSSQAAFYSLTAGFRNNAGSVAQVGATQKTALEDDTSWDATIDNSTTTIRILVTGKAATTIRWTVIYTRLEVIP